MSLEQAIYHLQNQVLPDMPCSECKKEHEQLLSWLKQLKQRRQQSFLKQ